MTVGELLAALKDYPPHVEVGIVMHSIGMPWGDVVELKDVEAEVLDEVVNKMPRGVLLRGRG
jgi:hypothetical protein